MSLTLDKIKAALPESHLREGAEWLFSPKPFVLTKGEARKITRLGHPLAQFQKASDSIFQRSSKGSLPPWISQLLNAGKPDWIIQQQTHASLRDILPRVIRPDLIVTETGVSLTELDSVPGGMGITTWLTQLYTDAGFDVLGGREGIPEGFQKLLPDGGDILISEESKDYKPEMEWLAEQVDHVKVKRVEDIDSQTRDCYRFFEWFDWQNIPLSQELAKLPHLTSPCKPHLEEKLWLALFWSPALRNIWKQELRGSHLERLREIIPYGWVTDSTPLPPHAALPRLEVQTWDEVANFSQSERELVLKISGFNELAWGSRGVIIGHDLPSFEWKQAIEKAVTQHRNQPWILQDFAPGKIVEHPYFDPQTGEEKIMLGRVRLCPYFFTDHSGKTEFGGMLATIVPSDKKKIHGMKDGILVPCIVE